MWWKLNFIPFVVLFCCIHWWCSFPCNEARLLKMSIPLRLEAKEQKIQIPHRPWEFLQETSVRFGCQMSFPPFTVEEWIRIVDSFQIFFREFWHYFLHLLRIDSSWCPRASPNRCIVIRNASSGGQQPLWPSWCLGHSEPRLDAFFSTDQSTNQGPFNTRVQKLSVFIPSRIFKDDFRCKHLKSEVC